jgi:large subunit ribosomal protein L18
MASGPRYKVPLRRMREGRTNYRRRLKMITSKKPRIVARKSTRHTRLQLVVPSLEGDKTLASAESIELKKYGYPGTTRNTPAAYLTGLLFGKRVKKAGYGEAILDLGLHKSTRGSKLYAALKGLLDAGIKVPHDPEMFPSEERIRGGHIAAFKNIPLDDIKNRIQGE